MTDIQDQLPPLPEIKPGDWLYVSTWGGRLLEVVKAGPSRIVAIEFGHKTHVTRDCVLAVGTKDQVRAAERAAAEVRATFKAREDEARAAVRAAQEAQTALRREVQIASWSAARAEGRQP